MINHLLFLLLLFTSLFANSQNEPDSLNQYIPVGHFIVEQVVGDLNKDGVDDYVLITKGTDKSQIITDEYQRELDRNRRGIVILFKNDNGYETVISNSNCFSSENKNGGAYDTPELSVDIKKGILFIQYSHGRYGWWRYTLRYQNNDFELIGYDSISNNGSVVSQETSINYSTKKKQTKKNTYTAGEFEDPIFEETWEDIQIFELIKLSKINDFDELDIGNL